jgi:hypothetical protein
MAIDRRPLVTEPVVRQRIEDAARRIQRWRLQPPGEEDDELVELVIHTEEFLCELAGVVLIDDEAAAVSDGE